MSNLSSAIYKINTNTPNAKSKALDVRWTRDISKRLKTRRKSLVGVKCYHTPSGSPRVAIRAKPDEKKGFRAVKVYSSGNLCDRIRIGVGTSFNEESSAPSVYRFTNGTMYVELPFHYANGDGGSRG